MLKGHKTVMLALGWRIETLVRGIADYAREHRWHLVFQNGGDFERDLRNWRGDGLICALPEEILSCRSWENTAIVSLITLRNFPFPYRMIREDDYAVGGIAAEYFLKRGYRNFAAYSISRRCEGFRETLEKHGCTCICSGTMFNRDQQELARWLKALPAPCALFCENDWDAADAVNAAIWNGLRIPSSLAILGGGNNALVCNAPAIPISSVDFRYYELGQRVAEEMDRILDGEKIDPEPLHFPPSPLVVERRSTDFFAVSNLKLTKILELLRRNAERKISLHEVAKQFALSDSALYKLCVRNLGISPKEFLLEQRLSRVRELLLSTRRQTMEEIAENCGFPTPGAMFSAFRKTFHMSPGEWRRNNKSDLP